MAQWQKNSPAMQVMWIWSLGREDPLLEEMATHSSILAWKISCIEEPGGLQSMGLQRVRHDWTTEHTHKLKLQRSTSKDHLNGQNEKRLTFMSVDTDVEQLDLSYITGEMWIASTSWLNCQYILEPSIFIPCGPAIPFIDIVLKWMNVYIHQKLYIKCS